MRGRIVLCTMCSLWGCHHKGGGKWVGDFVLAVSCSFVVIFSF
jgi:hypothetical protein